MTKYCKLFLDSANIPVADTGIRDFWWPVARTRLETMRDQLNDVLVPLIRQGMARNERKYALVRILYFEFLREIMKSYQAWMLFQASREHKRTLVIPNHHKILTALSENRQIERPPILRQLRAGHRRPNCLRRFLRQFRNLKGQTGYRYIVKDKCDCVEAVTVALNPFLLSYAASCGFNEDNFAVCSLWEWFFLLAEEENELDSTNRWSCDDYEEFLQITEDCFRANGFRPSKYLWSYLTDFLYEGTRLVGFYYDRIIRNQASIPKNLWYGSSNDVWLRTLRAAVRLKGGRCIGQDHGRGISLFPNRGEHGSVLDLCDEFVTLSPILAAAFEDREDEFKDQLLEPSQIKFVGYKNPLKMRRTREYDYSDKETKTVVYVAGMYIGERIAGMNLLPHDYWFIDWQARLFSYLKAQGFRIFMKTHPESRYAMPSAFQDRLGVIPLSGYMEDLVATEDFFIFDFFSTAIKTLLYTSKPLIFIDFGFGETSEVLSHLLNQRMAIVKGWMSESNRAEVNWSHLQDAFRLAQKKSEDRVLVDTVYGIKND